MLTIFAFVQMYDHIVRIQLAEIILICKEIRNNYYLFKIRYIIIRRVNNFRFCKNV